MMRTIPRQRVLREATQVNRAIATVMPTCRKS